MNENSSLKPFSSTMESRVWYLNLFLLAALMVVWPMPGTIALRNVLMGLMLVSAAFGAYRYSGGLNSIKVPFVAWVLGILTVWLVVNTLWINAPIGKGLRELRGQWFTSISFAMIGWLLGVQAYKQPRWRSAIVSVIVSVLFVQILFNDVIDLLYIVEVGRVPFRADPASTWPDVLLKAFQGWKLGEMPLVTTPDKFSYVVGLFDTIIIAELCSRIVSGKKFLPVKNSLLIGSLCLGLLACYFLSLRNGFLELSFLLLVSCMTLSVFYKNGSFRKWLMGLALGIGIAIVTIFISIQSDPRWSSLIESVSIGLNTDRDRSWLNPIGELPRLSNGETVDNSYLRIAWAKEGLSLILDNPLGYGFNRSAYGAGIDAKYGGGGRLADGHSHSGIVDFGIANGVPGLLLWVLYNASLIAYGVKGVRTKESFLGLFLVFIVLSYGFRSIVDSTIRDHMLQQYLFITMLLLGLITVKESNDKNSYSS